MPKQAKAAKALEISLVAAVVDDRAPAERALQMAAGMACVAFSFSTTLEL